MRCKLLPAPCPAPNLPLTTPTPPWRRTSTLPGNPVYPAEHQRILGERAKRTERLQRAAERRGAPLRLAYSLAMAACFLMIAASGAVAGGA